jgi:hypothetical protein
VLSGNHFLVKDPIRSHSVLVASHLLRLRRRRLGEASGVIGATAEVGRLGAGLNHCECWCWCEVGDLSSSVLVWMINWQGRERWMAIDKAMSEWRHTLKCKLETAEKFKVLVLMSVKRASRFAKGCAIKLRQVVVERSLSEPKEWTGFC